ncbi:MAG: hypothetical protein KDD52_09790 [Bdellovibrionales bacterium]|nr:hypothetical protein [Bdellovibrionales bacterium]
MSERKNLIKNIARFEGEQGAQRIAIQKYEWDCEVPLYVMTRNDALRVLDKYLCNEITSEDLQAWASFLEQREDIAFEEEASVLLDKMVFLLANPEINFPISKELIEQIRLEISADEA